MIAQALLTSWCLLGAAFSTASEASETFAVPPAGESPGLSMDLQCPCAYLERGGFWNSDVARSLGLVERVYAEKRCSCAYDFNCDKHWKASDKSLTMEWLGTHGISDSEIQLQFCSQISPPGTPICGDASGGVEGDEVAFTLRQVGWWVDLVGINCRCPGTATIQGFRYLDPLPAGQKLSRQIVEFACAKLAECKPQQPCYQEALNPSGLRAGGRVLCSCRAGTYCPIYRHLELNSANASQADAGINLVRCHPEP